MGNKKQSNFFKSDLHGVTPVPLAALREELVQLAQDRTNIIIEVDTSDVFRFRIVRRGRGGKVSAIAYLRRWQGTYTRIDIRGRLHGFTTNQRSRFFGGIGLILALGLLWLFPEVEAFAPSWFIILAIMLAVYMLCEYVFLTTLFSESEYTKRVLLDGLMQDLANGVTSVSLFGFIELEDEISDNELMRIINEKRQGIQLTSDGEFF